MPQGPKEGVVDPNGDPHVGGNTFQGGTGGADTPGMGGQGGAYRVAPPGGVVQLAEADKAQLSQQVNEARREMAQKALQARLKQIDMSEYEARAYERYVNAVRREIAQLRVIFESVEAKEKGAYRARLGCVGLRAPLSACRARVAKAQVERRSGRQRARGRSGGRSQHLQVRAFWRAARIEDTC